MSLSRTTMLSIILVGFLSEPAARAASTPVVIVTPQDGDVVPPKFEVKITYGDVSYGDTEGSGDAPADSVELWVDNDMLLAQCSPCPSANEAFFEVELMPGEHVLVAIASYLSAEESSGPITINVEQEAEGCECSTTSDPKYGFLWLGITWLSTRRRRARVGNRSKHK